MSTTTSSELITHTAGEQMLQSADPNHPFLHPHGSCVPLAAPHAQSR